MIILDTNVISEFMKTQKSAIVREWVAAQPLISLFTTTIIQAEILYGIALLPEGKRGIGQIISKYQKDINL